MIWSNFLLSDVEEHIINDIINMISVGFLYYFKNKNNRGKSYISQHSNDAQINPDSKVRNTFL